MNDAPLAITMGDASGIGPEIIVKALAQTIERAVVYGSMLVMERTVARLGLSTTLRQIGTPREVRFEPGTINLIDATGIATLPPSGVANAVSGQAAFDAVVAAIAAARANAVSGIVTAPITKEAMALAGLRYPGHTESLAILAMPGASR